MDKEYYGVYEQLYDALSRRFVTARQESEFLVITYEMLEKTIDFVGVRQRLRPDAKLFLLINLDQMIITPLSVRALRHRPSADPLLVEEYTEAIRTDLQTILTVASQNVGEGSEISGHAVIDAISESWGDLKSTGFQIWG